MKNIQNKTILIIGCGWVGKSLGRECTQQGARVFGTTRSEDNFSELNSYNVDPVLLELPVSENNEINLPDFDAAVISISPGRGGDRSKYVRIVEQLGKYMADKNAPVIMYSSTSVYNGLKGEVKETDRLPDSESDNELLGAEGVLKASVPQAVILRLSGLYAEDRHPVFYLAGRNGIPNGDAPVNLVHRYDVIKATMRVLFDDSAAGDIFNICAREHPPKSQIYTSIAKKLNLDIPEFLKGGKDGKFVNAGKIRNTLGLKFKHNDPIDYPTDT